MFSWDHIDTEIFPEGFRDKIFNTEIIAALGCALSNESMYFRDGVVNFFTAATAQGALCCFYGIFTLKYSQRNFGKRYLALRSLLHLDVH